MYTHTHTQRDVILNMSRIILVQTNFFGGSHSIDMLTKKRNMLLGIADEDDGTQTVQKVSRNPPWIECCLKSYYTDKSDIWGSRNYRIFATTFVV